MTRQTYTAWQDEFSATLVEEAGECVEVVMIHTDDDIRFVHEAAFPSSNLGAANRDEYVRVMLSSIVAREKRNVK